MKTPTKISNKKLITTALFNLVGAGFPNRITDLKKELLPTLELRAYRFCVDPCAAWK